MKLLEFFPPALDRKTREQCPCFAAEMQTHELTVLELLSGELASVEKARATETLQG